MNDILKYTSKDYNSIYKDLVEAIPTLTGLWTNTNAGDPGIVLVKLMSALGDMLSYNLDKQALEYYSSTVTQRKNAAKLFNLIGYKMHWYQSATNQITLTNTMQLPVQWEFCYQYEKMEQTTDIAEKKLILDNINTIIRPEFQETLPYSSYPQYYLDSDTLLPNTDLYTELTQPNPSGVGNPYTDYMIANAINLYTYIMYPNRTLALYNDNYESIPYLIIPTTEVETDGSGSHTILPKYVVKPNDSVKLNIIQGNLHSVKFTATQLHDNRYYFNETAIDENNMWLAYSAVPTPTYVDQYGFITKVDNLLTTTDGDVHFEFNIDEYDRPYIELSSYWMTKKDENGNILLPDTVTFTLMFIRTNGRLGNITTNYFKYIEGVVNSQSSRYTLTNPSNNTPYYDSEGYLVACPGKHPELPYEAYVNSLNWVTTFNTLVTIYDFERFCKRHEGITNAFAVDKQRATDLNKVIADTADSYNISQLQAFASMSSADPHSSDLGVLKQFYKDHKNVYYEDGLAPTNEGTDYKPYQLQLHVVYGNFSTKQTVDSLDSIADITIKKPDAAAVAHNTYWLYKIKDIGTDNIATALDRDFHEIRVANVLPAYSSVRVFPWRCCGVLHLKAPVTRLVANTILNTVMQHLKQAFNPRNLEFGKQISYMDVINVVTNAHDSIRYFDAGLGNRKLIDIDESIDFTYFNPTSLMYYIQDMNTYTIPLADGTSFIAYGNNIEYVSGGHANPYYQLLSIAPEYIID